eukprot:3470723-Pleurochrysis_carterae.AAC.1
MQGDASQRAIDLSAVLGFLRNQILFYQRNPLSLFVLPLSPHLVLVRMRRVFAVRQPQARPSSAMSRKSNHSGSTAPV